MSKLRTASTYDWDWNFWTHLQDASPSWAAQHAEEDRSIFEREVEEMIADSIPAELGAVRRAYSGCEWSEPLFTAFELSAGHDGEEINIRSVKAQMLTGFGRITAGGKLLPPPPVRLPFPESALEAFIDQLKLAAYATLAKFHRSYPQFLASLPPDVARRLRGELFGLSVSELMAVLSGT